MFQDLGAPHFLLFFFYLTPFITNTVVIVLLFFRIIIIIIKYPTYYLYTYYHQIFSSSIYSLIIFEFGISTKKISYHIWCTLFIYFGTTRFFIYYLLETNSCNLSQYYMYYFSKSFFRSVFLMIHYYDLGILRSGPSPLVKMERQPKSQSGKVQIRCCCCCIY